MAATSDHCSSIAIFYPEAEKSAIEDIRLHSLNVVSFQLVTGRWKWHVVGYYIAPIDALNIEDVAAAIRG